MLVATTKMINNEENNYSTPSKTAMLKSPSATVFKLIIAVNVLCGICVMRRR